LTPEEIRKTVFIRLQILRRVGGQKMSFAYPNAQRRPRRAARGHRKGRFGHDGAACNPSPVWLSASNLAATREFQEAHS
jgi:hypothetical protein